MKRLIPALILVSSLVLCACSGGSSSMQGNDTNARQQMGQKVAFRGIEFEVPDTWAEQDLDPGTMEDVAGWQCGSDADGNGLGMAIAYSMRYDAFGNTDTQMPDPSNPTQQEIKKTVDSGLKALDARVMLELIAGAALRTYDDTAAVDQSAFRLIDLQGHAVWTCEWNVPAGTVCGYCVALDDRAVAVFFNSPSETLTSEQKATADSISVVEVSDGLLLERAKLIEGLSQDEAMNVIIEDAQIPAQSDSSASSFGGSPSGSSASSPGSGGTSSADSSSGDVWVQNEDGDNLRFGEDGSVTLYNDHGITTRNEDGSMEWTDGYGTGVRDVDGDGEPDYVTYDSGETWEHL
ncbi:MAG: hypothetical protein IJH08_01705 [Atopobiaceae bacterium]|nr:hypothetical protein [Atopobiaceae bacterium]